MLAESQLDIDVFDEIVVEDAPVDDHVVMRLDAQQVPDLFVDDLLGDHDVLDLLVDDLLDLDELVLAHLLGYDDDYLVVVDPLDLDLDHAVHVDVLVDNLLVDDLAAQDVSLLLVDLLLLLNDDAELSDADLDVQDDLLILVDVLLVDELALLDESALSLFVFDVLLFPESGVPDHDVELERLAGHVVILLMISVL